MNEVRERLLKLEIPATQLPEIQHLKEKVARIETNSDISSIRARLDSVEAKVSDECKRLDQKTGETQAIASNLK